MAGWQVDTSSPPDAEYYVIMTGFELYSKNGSAFSFHSTSASTTIRGLWHRLSHDTASDQSLIFWHGISHNVASTLGAHFTARGCSGRCLAQGSTGHNTHHTHWGSCWMDGAHLWLVKTQLRLQVQNEPMRLVPYPLLPKAMTIICVDVPSR